MFFGGGTPSLFAPEDIARLLGGVAAAHRVRADAEITLEANPGTIERGRFAGYRDAGINRVSLGAQSFRAARARAARAASTTPEDTLRAVEELRAAGLDNFNLDLMYALPEQTLEEAVADVRTALALGPAHISYYQLTLEPGTVFHARPPPLPDEDAAWTHADRVPARCWPARLSHNTKCRPMRAPAPAAGTISTTGLFGDYLGVGAGAHGKLTVAAAGRILRTAKPKQPRDYQQSAASAGGADRRAPRVAAAASCRSSSC